MPEEEPKDAYVYIKLSDIRYDRSDLFDNVPVFNYPLIGFNEHARRNKLWQMIKRAIFTPFPEEKRHFLRLIEASQEMMYNESERQKEEDFPGYVKSRSHNFPFYYIKMTQGQYDLLHREGFINRQREQRRARPKVSNSVEEELIDHIGASQSRPLMNPAMIIKAKMKLKKKSMTKVESRETSLVTNIVTTGNDT